MRRELHAGPSSIAMAQCVVSQSAESNAPRPHVDRALKSDDWKWRKRRCSLFQSGLVPGSCKLVAQARHFVGLGWWNQCSREAPVLKPGIMADVSL